MTEITKTVKKQTMTAHYAQVLLAQKIASVVLDSMKSKKSEKISALTADVEFVNGSRDGEKTILNFAGNGKDVQTVLTDTQVNGIDLDQRIIGKFQVNDVDKLGKVVQDQANGEVARAINMSKTSKTNPNMYRPAKGTHAKKSALMF